MVRCTGTAAAAAAASARTPRNRKGDILAIFLFLLVFSVFELFKCFVLVLLWNVNYILHEFLANGTNVFAECSGEHHNLFSVWCITEYLLDVATHVCVRKNEKQHLVSLISRIC